MSQNIVEIWLTRIVMMTSGIQLMESLTLRLLASAVQISLQKCLRDEKSRSATV